MIQKDSTIISTIGEGVQKNGEGIAMIEQKVDTLLTLLKPDSVLRGRSFLVPFKHQPNTFVSRERRLAAISRGFKDGSN